MDSWVAMNHASVKSDAFQRNAIKGPSPMRRQGNDCSCVPDRNVAQKSWERSVFTDKASQNENCSWQLVLYHSSNNIHLAVANNHTGEHLLHWAVLIIYVEQYEPFTAAEHNSVFTACPSSHCLWLVSLGESSFFLNQAKDIFVRVHMCEKKKEKIGLLKLAKQLMVAVFLLISDRMQRETVLSWKQRAEILILSVLAHLHQSKWHSTDRTHWCIITCYLRLIPSECKGLHCYSAWGCFLKHVKMCSHF